MNLEFDGSDHSYLLDGASVPSVTQILASEGIVSFEYCDETHRQRGTYVHTIAELVAKDWHGSTVEEIIRNSRWDPSTTDQALVPYGLAAAKWLLDTGFRPKLIEARVASLRFQIAGTLDAYGLMPSGERLLVDFKSGQAYSGAWIQLSLYEMCLKESLGLDVDERIIVELKPDGTYKALPPRKAGGVDLTVALSVLNVYRWRVKHKML